MENEFGRDGNCGDGKMCQRQPLNESDGGWKDNRYLKQVNNFQLHAKSAVDRERPHVLTQREIAAICEPADVFVSAPASA